MSDNLNQIARFENLLSEVAEMAATMDLDFLRPGVLRHWLMAVKLGHQITPDKPLDAKDRKDQPVEYLIRENDAPRWQLTSLSAGDDRGLNKICDRLLLARGGIFFGVFDQITLIRCIRIPPKPIVDEFRELFQRTRVFKKERPSPRRRVTLSIGNSFFQDRQDSELVFPSRNNLQVGKKEPRS